MLYETFSAFGNILSCAVMTDCKTDDQGSSKGYGHETQEASTLAVTKIDGMLLNGKTSHAFLARHTPPATLLNGMRWVVVSASRQAWLEVSPDHNAELEKPSMINAEASANNSNELEDYMLGGRRPRCKTRSKHKPSPKQRAYDTSSRQRSLGRDHDRLLKYDPFEYQGDVSGPQSLLENDTDDTSQNRFNQKHTIVVTEYYWRHDAAALTIQAVWRGTSCRTHLHAARVHQLGRRARRRLDCTPTGRTPTIAQTCEPISSPPHMPTTKHALPVGQHRNSPLRTSFPASSRPPHQQSPTRSSVRLSARANRRPGRQPRSSASPAACRRAARLPHQQPHPRRPASPAARSSASRPPAVAAVAAAPTPRSRASPTAHRCNRHPAWCAASISRVRHHHRLLSLRGSHGRANLTARRRRAPHRATPRAGSSVAARSRAPLLPPRKPRIGSSPTARRHDRRPQRPRQPRLAVGPNAIGQHTLAAPRDAG